MGDIRSLNKSLNEALKSEAVKIAAGPPTLQDRMMRKMAVWGHRSLQKRLPIQM
jgi:hypothetical protein